MKMKMSKHVLMLMPVVLGLSFVNAQTAGEIIAKHLEAIGGKEKISAITSIKMDNTMQIMGTDAQAVSTVLVGKGFKSESDFNGQKIVQVVTDKGGWAINPMAGGTAPQAISDEQFKASKYQLYFTPFIDYEAAGSKAELIGKEKLDGADVYKINFTTADSITTTYYFDQNTYNILKTVRKADMMGQEVEVSGTYSDFRKSDFGVTLPYSMNIDLGQFQMSLKVNKVDFNMPVDVSIFEMK